MRSSKFEISNKLKTLNFNRNFAFFFQFDVLDFLRICFFEFRIYLRFRAAEFNEEVQRYDDSILEVCRNVALSLDDC
jgi:hypothetical protein